jgi:hypothetical protein
VKNSLLRDYEVFKNQPLFFVAFFMAISFLNGFAGDTATSSMQGYPLDASTSKQIILSVTPETPLKNDGNGALSLYASGGDYLATFADAWLLKLSQNYCNQFRLSTHKHSETLQQIEHHLSRILFHVKALKEISLQESGETKSDDDDTEGK